MSRHAKTAMVALVLFVAMVLVVLLVPVGFVSRSPGVAVGLLGTDEAPSVIAVEGPELYGSAGQFYVTTFYQTPVDDNLRLVQAIFHHLLPSDEVVERSDVYQAGSTAESVAQQAQDLRTAAQTRAIVAALRQLELDRGIVGTQPLVREFVIVGDVQTGGPSDGKLAKGDVLELIAGRAVFSVAQVIREVRTGNSPGISLSVLFRHDGERREMAITLGQSELRLPTMGVTWEQAYDYSEFLEVVDFNLSPDIGGDAMGLALGLAVYDELTEEDLTGGRAIGAAGVIELIELPFGPEPAEGTLAAYTQPAPPADVATISLVDDGIRQQIIAAEQAGVTLFLVPAANCSDLAGLDTTVEVAPVATFAEAVRLLRALAADPEAAVPHC